MDIEKKINYILSKTDYEFHDSILLNINFNLEKDFIKLLIEHCRYNETDNIDNVYNSIFYFRKIRSLKINFFISDNLKMFECDEISQFDYKKDGENNIFKISGIKGWIIEFIADDFEYSEKKVDVYVY